MDKTYSRARQTKFLLFTSAYVLVALAIVTVANVLADRYNKTHDFTANKRYSLSDQTAKIVKNLKQPVTITYFDKPDRFSQAKDQLDQYANLSHQVHVEYIDTDKKPELARAAGIKTEGTALVQIGDRKEEAKSLTEEGITGAIIRDVKTATRTVCFVEGSGEHTIEDAERNGYSRFKELLATDAYESKSINLLQSAQVPPECTVLAIGGPDSDYMQPEVAAIKAYVENGGRALILLDPPLKMGRDQIADNDALTGVLQTWGITAEKNLVLDPNPIGQLMGIGPQVALVQSYDSHAIVNDLSARRKITGFPITRSLEIKNGDKTTVEKLFESSDTSLATTKLDSPQVNPNDPKNTKGPMTIAAAGSYTTGKENSQGRFVVVGSSSWATNGFLAFNGNRDLALNAINWLASDEDLISIRPKDPEDRRITLTQAQFNLIRICSQFLIPLLVVAAGITIWWRRR
jgi:ABC-type uncharacterized transport system involved in gliding motility auxiliary subunit